MEVKKGMIALHEEATGNTVFIQANNIQSVRCCSKFNHLELQAYKNDPDHMRRLMRHNTEIRYAGESIFVTESVEDVFKMLAMVV